MATAMQEGAPRVLVQSEGERWLKVEAKTFVFTKEGEKNFRISEQSRKMVKFLKLGGMRASWVAKGIEDCLELPCHEGFFRELRMGNGLLTIQHQSNVRGSFLQISDFKNGKKKALLIVPIGAKGNGWKGFAQSIRSISGIIAPTVEDLNRVKLVEGKTVGRSSLVKGASYASVLNNSINKGKGKIIVEDKGDQASDGIGVSAGSSRVGEVEGVLWAIKAQLSGVMEKVTDLMAQVDKGLDLVMGLNDGAKIDLADEIRAPIIANCVVGSDHKDIGVERTIFDGPNMLGSVVTSGTSVHATQVIDIMPSNSVITTDQASISQVNGGSPSIFSDSLVADGVVTSVEDGNSSKTLCILEGSVEVAQLESLGGGVSKSNALVPCEDKCLGSASGDKIIPLISLPPLEHSSSDWLLHTVNKIKKCVGVSHEGHDDQFTALISSIEAAHSRETKKFKKSRELKRLSCSINYGDSSRKTTGRSL